MLCRLLLLLNIFAATVINSVLVCVCVCVHSSSAVCILHSEFYAVVIVSLLVLHRHRQNTTETVVVVDSSQKHLTVSSSSSETPNHESREEEEPLLVRRLLCLLHCLSSVISSGASVLTPCVSSSSFLCFPTFVSTHTKHTLQKVVCSMNTSVCSWNFFFSLLLCVCFVCTSSSFFIFYCSKFFFHFFVHTFFWHPLRSPRHLSSTCVLSLTVQNQHWLCCTSAFPFDFSSHCVSQVQFAYLIWYHLLAGADVVAFLFSVLFICSVHTFHFVRWCDYICACVQQCWHQAMINRTSLNSYGRSSSSSNEGTVFWACVCEHYQFFFLFADHYITLLINIIISGQQLQYNNGCC